ncbi:4-(cytidine 5'-diphospho)-2-C-methyl-D-erythritol kinase, partial [Streptomyces sp. NPDC056323]
MSITVRVPAKVNVQLAVGAPRPDGFHDLANVFLAVGLYDEVTVTPADGLRITCSGPDAAQVPLDASNLAARAAIALAERHGIAPDVHIHIAKDIPVAGGMAGGEDKRKPQPLGCSTPLSPIDTRGNIPPPRPHS